MCAQEARRVQDYGEFFYYSLFGGNVARVFELVSSLINFLSLFCGNFLGR